MKSVSETETVIKKIVPYLLRRGYDLENDMTFEEPADLDTEARKGFVDILVNCGKSTPLFLIEAKRDGTKINAKHKQQAIEYGSSKKCLFVAVTNGKIFELLNAQTEKPLKLNESAFNRIPSKNDLTRYFIPQLKKDPKTDVILIPSDRTIPFSPSLPLSKLNHLFKQCHNSIRKIEKNEEHAFSDFSKILFLKLLEEKWDDEKTKPPYTYAFHELSSYGKDRSDQVQTAIKSMIETIKNKTKFGEVLSDPIYLKQDATYLTIVKTISGVSFIDCDYDTKGAAFEYFVRATLKGKKLGQYFTPRPLVKLMVELGRYKQIVNNLMANQPFKVLDPACGTGGFLVYAMKLCINDVQDKLNKNEIHQTLSNTLIKKLKEETFYGIDAHDGVASSAKMNMVVAGDGHNNIRCIDSLKEKQLVPKYRNSDKILIDDGKAHLILTNPPLGTSEGESLNAGELGHYEVQSTKGQSLFIQRMINSIHIGSRIVTVIDDGVLNTTTDSELRTLILKECKVELVLSLPYETFRANKINVKTSVLVLEKRKERDEDLQDDYPIGFIKIQSLGYDGAGDNIRNFDLNLLIKQLSELKTKDLPENDIHQGYSWIGFKVKSSKIVKDSTKRLDMKYWDASIIKSIEELRKKSGTSTIKDINTIETKRGDSPPESEYVSESEGYALVVKAGTNISKNGKLITSGDYLEEGFFKEKFSVDKILHDGDILLASTGDGTLGKCCVYRNNDSDGVTKPAIADGHVTVIRVNNKIIYPEFLCDYLRKGFGSEQIIRLFTGSTGLIEIQPDDVDRIVIPPLPSIKEQEKISNRLRDTETKVIDTIKQLNATLAIEKDEFFKRTLSFQTK